MFTYPFHSVSVQNLSFPSLVLSLRPIFYFHHKSCIVYILIALSYKREVYVIAIRCQRTAVCVCVCARNDKSMCAVWKMLWKERTIYIKWNWEWVGRGAARSWLWKCNWAEEKTAKYWNGALALQQMVSILYQQYYECKPYIISFAFAACKGKLWTRLFDAKLWVFSILWNRSVSRGRLVLRTLFCGAVGLKKVLNVWQRISIIIFTQWICNWKQRIRPTIRPVLITM